MATTLQAVQEQFALWRQHKTFRRERVPEHLWQAALSLLPQYSQTEIIKTLQLSSDSFRQRQEAQAHKKQRTPQIPHFVELSGLINPSTSFSSLPCRQIELERPDGCRLRLFSAAEQPLQGLEVVQEFLKGNHASGRCSNPDFSSRESG